MVGVFFVWNPDAPCFDGSIAEPWYSITPRLSLYPANN